MLPNNLILHNRSRVPCPTCTTIHKQLIILNILKLKIILRFIKHIIPLCLRLYISFLSLYFQFIFQLGFAFNFLICIRVIKCKSLYKMGVLASVSGLWRLPIVFRLVYDWACVFEEVKVYQVYCHGFSELVFVLFY